MYILDIYIHINFILKRNYFQFWSERSVNKSRNLTMLQLIIYMFSRGIYENN